MKTFGNRGCYQIADVRGSIYVPFSDLHAFIHCVPAWFSIVSITINTQQLLYIVPTLILFYIEFCEQAFYKLTIIECNTLYEY